MFVVANGDPPQRNNREFPNGKIRNPFFFLLLIANDFLTVKIPALLQPSFLQQNG